MPQGLRNIELKKLKADSKLNVPDVFFVKLIYRLTNFITFETSLKPIDMKKKITLLFLTIFVSATIYSQNYNISFVATGASSSVNSVKVENLMQSTSVTLNAGDILHLGPVGVYDIDAGNENLQILPNPMQDKAELSFYADKDGDAQISIIDIMGKEVMRTDNKFTKGIQKFRLTGLKQGMYFINISNETYFYTTKLISQNTAQADAKIEYTGSENSTITTNQLKNTYTTVNMAYTDGDRLLFKGISGNYSNIITDIPTASKTITFNLTACSDFDNNNYATVQIGTQTWMAENLKTTHYKNGTAIPNVTDNAAWAALATGAYCDYNNTPANSTTYGSLYNWFTVNTGNLCPTGWHLPINAEWETLTTFMGGESIAGGKLKATTLWNSPNTGATNETGFTALPGGGRYTNGSYYDVGNYGSWWNSPENGSAYAWFMNMGYSSSNALSSSFYKTVGYSVRCIKN